MTNGTVCREAGRNVVGHSATQGRGALPVRGVASVACRGTERVVVVDVAGSARSRSRGHVHPRQSKSRRAVVESSCRPTHRGVASGAVRNRKRGPGSGVRRGVGILPVRQMAAGSSASSRRYV
jgi:hypothetical protein